MCNSFFKIYTYCLLNRLLGLQKAVFLDANRHLHDQFIFICYKYKNG